MGLKQVTAKVTQWYNNQQKRERIMVLCCVSVVLVYGVHLFVLAPVQRKNEQSRLQVTEQKTRYNELKSQKIVALAWKDADPDRQNRAEYQKLDGVLTELQKNLDQAVEKMVAPAQMAVLLKELLTVQEGMELLSLENGEPEKILFEQQDKDTSPQTVLYRHPLTMRFTSSYLSTLEYLRKLEHLPKELIMEQMSIQTDNYPDAEVELHIFTLSLEEGWIGD